MVKQKTEKNSNKTIASFPIDIMLESLTDVTFAIFLLTGAPECQFHLQIWMKPTDVDNINRNGNVGKVGITSRVTYFF